jgi:murein DD-endopeptidase MepM/ murein hydrolase activator NlpD
MALAACAHARDDVVRAGPPRGHEVRAGDTLSAIARRYGVTVAALVAANRLPSAGTVIRPGQRLVIPPSPTAVLLQPETKAPAAHPLPIRPVSVPPSRGLAPPENLSLAIPDFRGPVPEFLWPTEGPVISTYGLRSGQWHRGIDIKGPTGERIRAAADGVVVVSGVEGGYGRVVKLEHAGGFVTLYAHNHENLVAVGERVEAGQAIATVGRTGDASTPHVHFEILHAGSNLNPLYLLPLPPRIVQVDLTDEYLTQGP